MLTTVDETCDLIARWCQETVSCPGEPVNANFAVPDCIVRLNARIGALWRSATPEPGPVLRYATPFRGLLGGQDDILDPSEYARDEHGIVPFIRENQHVWSLGFDPNDVDQLLVSGAWRDSSGEDFKTKWRPIAAKPEDALICTLLVNMCMQSETRWDDKEPKPEAAHLVLWQHPEWYDFYHFWINDEQTLIWFGGFHVTRGKARPINGPLILRGAT